MASLLARMGRNGAAERPDNHVAVLSGATGDLAKRELLRALLNNPPVDPCKPALEMTTTGLDGVRRRSGGDAGLSRD
jgi:hypothetical protein